jgi:hypothetical protein
MKKQIFLGGEKDKTTKTCVNELPLICGSWAPIFWGLVTDNLEGGKGQGAFALLNSFVFFWICMMTLD